MWRVHIKSLASAAMAGLMATSATAATDPYAFRLEVTPEEGPLVPAVEARYSAAYRRCGEDGATTQDAAQCLVQELPRQDKALNAAWKVAYGRARGARHAGLLAAQRKWLVAREPFCRKLSDEFSGGTIAPVVYVSCKVELTIRRTIWLENLK